MRVDDLGSQDAYELLGQLQDAQLVDVRRDDERAANGAPSLEPLGKDAIHAVWPSTPGAPLDGFLSDVENALETRGAAKDSPVLLICRSGVRSRAAAEALAQRGWTRTINVAGGFSGNATTSGWAGQGLPILHT